jgi:hypothetical protein
MKNRSKKINYLIGVFALLIFWPAFHSITSGNDFDIFIRAAYHLNEGKELYSQPFVNGLYYYYSPIFTWFLQPFTPLKEYIISDQGQFKGITYSLALVKVFWSILGMFLTWRIIRIISSIFTFQSTKKEFLFWLISMILCYRWFFMNLWYGQLTIFILWGILESHFGSFFKGVFKWFPIALGINIKILPLVFFGKWTLEKNVKAIFQVFIWFGILVLIPFIFYPWEYISDQTIKWFSAINPLKKNHVITVGEGGFIDIGAMVVKFFTNYKIPTEPMACIAELSHSSIFWITQVFRLLIIVITAWQCYNWDSKKNNMELNSHSNETHIEFVKVSLFTLIIPLIFPHQRDYSLTLLLPSLIYMIYQWVQHPQLQSNVFLFLFLVPLAMMGCVVFFELFSLETRYWIIGSRIQGLGGLIYFFIFHAWLLHHLKISKSIRIDS